MLRKFANASLNFIGQARSNNVRHKDGHITLIRNRKAPVRLALFVDATGGKEMHDRLFSQIDIQLDQLQKNIRRSEFFRRLRKYLVQGIQKLRGSQAAGSNISIESDAKRKAEFLLYAYGTNAENNGALTENYVGLQTLKKKFSAIECRAGGTNIGRNFNHLRDAIEKGKIEKPDAIVLLGNHVNGTDHSAKYTWLRDNYKTLQTQTFPFFINGEDEQAVENSDLKHFANLATMTGSPKPVLEYKSMKLSFRNNVFGIVIPPFLPKLPPIPLRTPPVKAMLLAMGVTFLPIKLANDNNNSKVTFLPPAPSDFTAMREISNDTVHGFDFNSSALKPHMKDKLEKIFQQTLARNSDIDSIRISGNACYIGPEDYNLRLSDRRAKTIATELQKKFQEAGLKQPIFAIGKGECQETPTPARDRNAVIEYISH
ncbi:MAG: OmpA family protein [Alphaproteobacteria bacterium]|nr:OmpA family protein [Alphaproteobacteria bacterium]